MAIRSDPVAPFAAVVGAKCGLPPIQVMAILGGAFDAIAALEAESLVRVHTDIGVVCGVITGSFPTSDAAFGPTRNALELALRLDERLRLDLADVTATIVTDADVTRVRVDNAMDIEEQKPMNLIHGQHVFRVAGFNMVLSDEGATVFLQNAIGTTFPVTVDEVISKQLFTARSAELLEAGGYKLVVKSRGGDAEGPLQTSFRRVKYLRVVDPPRITSAHSENTEDNHVNCGGEAMVVEGENLDTATQIEMLDGEGNVFHTVAATYADGKLTTRYIYLDSNPPEGSVRVTTAGGCATYEVVYDHH
ncbi:MAG: hypothetical protein K6G91_08390 [Kiritimatiellae bacterium]|nr:hypothetical protein [Kiritimatiellia bacterium]